MSNFTDEHPAATAVLQGIVAGTVAALVSPFTPVATAFIAAAVVVAGRLPDFGCSRTCQRNQKKTNIPSPH